MENKFEQASRLKLRFDSSKGFLSVEDLWDLPLSSAVGKASLDDIAVALDEKLKTTKKKSFVIADAGTKENEILQLKFDLVLHVIETKKSENSARHKEIENRAEEQRLLALLDKKKTEKDENLSEEEIEAKLKLLRKSA